MADETKERAPISDDELTAIRNRDLKALTQKLMASDENLVELWEAIRDSQHDVQPLRYEVDRLRAALARAEQTAADARRATVWWAHDESDYDEWDANAMFANEQHAMDYALNAWMQSDLSECEEGHVDLATCEECQARKATYRDRLKWLKPSYGTWWELWLTGGESGGKDMRTGIEVSPTKLHWPEALAADVPAAAPRADIHAAGVALDEQLARVDAAQVRMNEVLAQRWDDGLPAAAPMPAGLDLDLADKAREAVALAHVGGYDNVVIRALKLLRDGVLAEGGDGSLTRLKPYVEWAMGQRSAADEVKP